MTNIEQYYDAASEVYRVPSAAVALSILDSVPKDSVVVVTNRRGNWFARLVHKLEALVR